jgi:uncharacterized membrane protein
MKLGTAVQFCVFQFYCATCLISVCRSADGSYALDTAVIWQWQGVLVVVIIRATILLQYDTLLSRTPVVGIETVYRPADPRFEFRQR